MRRIPDEAGGFLPFPGSEELASREVSGTDLCTQPPANVLKVFNTIVARNAERIMDYGRYLFDNLIGKVIWEEMVEQAKLAKASLVELALSWPRKDGNLSRLHWEMMADSANFLAAGHLLEGKSILDVAITRVVPDTTSVAATMSPLPRVLFVIGTSLSDRTIRPGAEVMGLLRDPQIESRIYPRVIENASPKLVMRNVTELRPEVVHFICHGDMDARSKAGYIEMKPDAGDEQTTFFAPQLWQWLSVAGAPPQMVVLSACQSGAALGPHAVAPLAADLVAEGVPVVIAMSGRVSDLACRLFTRRLGQALLSGETLVSATAKGRRAAIAEGDAPTRSVDWGFPALYLSSKVKEDYVPGANSAEAGGDLEKRIDPYLLRRERQPAFCGRQDFFEAYYDIFANNSKTGAVLVAYTNEEKKGYGRTRLLQELTIQALRDGHVPCAVLAYNNEWEPPKDPLDLALRIHKATETARSSLGLETGGEGPIILLKQYAQEQLHLEMLPDWLARALRVGAKTAANEVTPYAIAKAIEEQFAQLMKEARKEAPEFVGERSRAILLLDEVHDYFRDLDSIASHLKLGAWGFGSATEPVPVIMAFSLGTPISDMLKPIAESGKNGWRAIALGPFDRDPQRPEDMLAYARVLMNPFDKTLGPQISDRAWVMDYDIKLEDVEFCETKFRMWLKGLPGEFTDGLFYALAQSAEEKKFLKLATDEDELRKLLQENVKVKG